MAPTGVRGRKVALVSILGAVLIAVAVALNIGWIVVNWRTGLLLLAGIISFAVLIAGLALNTAFLIREIRRTEQHNTFIHAVTHELKTPLASITLHLQTLRQRSVDTAKQQEFIETMLADTVRLQSTIDQVLLAGKTGNTRRVVNATDVDLSDVVAECMAVAGKQHHLINGELQLVDRVPQGEEAVVMGDRDELQAAVANLIDNAIKYSGERVKVAVELVKTGARRISITVMDQGMGITRDELKHVFGRFYRIPGGPDRACSRNGARAFDRALLSHAGTAGAPTSRVRGPGKGSRFTLELPLKPS